MKFEDYNLDDKVKQGLEELDFKKPTDIQYKSIFNILDGEDLIAIAHTGTGKTAAFAIPIIDMVLSKKNVQRRYSGVQALVMVPTHELALQIASVFHQIAKYTDVKTISIIGGMDQDPQIEALTTGVDIIIATPGRMFDLISQGHFQTHRIEILVLDEADHMLDMGFKDDIIDILKKLPKRRQTLFFSATINDHIKKTAYKIVKQGAIRIQLSTKNPVAKNIEHFVLFVDKEHKRFFLERVINENRGQKILAFVRTKVRAERVSKAMARVDIPSLTIHGDKTQEERITVLENFRSGDVNLLIGTDITARGIDIPDISIVINYDLPDESENYVHRVGRTGRGNRKGNAYSFCSPEEKEVLNNIQEFLEKDINVLNLDGGEYHDTLHVERDRTNDYMSLIKEMEEREESKKKSYKWKKKKK